MTKFIFIDFHVKTQTADIEKRTSKANLAAFCCVSDGIYQSLPMSRTKGFLQVVNGDTVIVTSDAFLTGKNSLEPQD